MEIQLRPCRNIPFLFTCFARSGTLRPRRALVFHHSAGGSTARLFIGVYFSVYDFTPQRTNGLAHSGLRSGRLPPPPLRTGAGSGHEAYGFGRRSCPRFGLCSNGAALRWLLPLFPLATGGTAPSFFTATTRKKTARPLLRGAQKKI